MAENNWVLQDGRVILVEFAAAQAANNWGWFGNRSSGEGSEFSTPSTAWANHAWLRGGQYIMAAEAGGATIDCTVVMNQVQNISGTFGLTRDITGLVSQVQSSSGTFGRTINSTGSLSQSQSITGSFGRTLDFSCQIQQVQNITGVFGRVLDGTVSTSQVQSISGIFGFETIVSGFWMTLKRRRRI